MHFIPFRSPFANRRIAAGIGLFMLIFAFSCGKKDEKQQAAQQPAAPKEYPVMTIEARATDIYTDYPATLQGQENVEIRPRIDGYIERIFVDEGALVRKGQVLFQISAPQYEQDLRTAQASIKIAEADVNAAQMQVNKVKPLVEKDIISHYELESAEYTLQSRQAALAQAKATLANARINLGYTRVTSPVDGVIGLLPLKLGSLVSQSTTTPLTTVANIGNVYAYFSLNEKQLLDFFRDTKGNTLQQKLATLPSVSLVLSDGSVYSKPGRVETASGLISTETGSANFRATFPNTDGFLRSGSTGQVRVTSHIENALIIPQKATYELQGKRLAYLVAEGNKVKSVEIQVKPTTDGKSFIVTQGVKAGDKIVVEGITALRDDMEIKPGAVKADTTANAQ
ncbi:efflux RND transporter periplasmic adaptor subunit [Siphonobacter sp. SORGH_AS_1065]|uniref:efflux RND transporter periplasmic adaptor subunit n=1 Tax=Siphonobacter sp. SORGH_AS_1065 TaxID=3041795 RepID=UPI002780B9CF|nr:efflux RND transporter periplasmic adaptor subunit [Siphonobacter sp. SORGH_AS_1065]MDQ1088117.1 membrane fusion protein (multidrug efflux system) [Siphonobacter sp. SORGH_AS_1065]